MNDTKYHFPEIRKKRLLTEEPTELDIEKLSETLEQMKGAIPFEMDPLERLDKFKINLNDTHSWAEWSTDGLKRIKYGNPTHKDIDLVFKKMNIKEFDVLVKKKKRIRVAHNTSPSIIHKTKKIRTISPNSENSALVTPLGNTSKGSQ